MVQNYSDVLECLDYQESEARHKLNLPIECSCSILKFLIQSFLGGSRILVTEKYEFGNRKKNITISTFLDFSDNQYSDTGHIIDKFSKEYFFTCRMFAVEN